MSMSELAVLFLHHADDAATRNNLAALRHHNPWVPVVPVSNFGVRLPGGYDARQMTTGWRKMLPSHRRGGLLRSWGRLRKNLEPRWVWRNSDLPAYMFMLWKNRPVQARRWFIFEWDMYCNVNLADWLGPVMDSPVVATSLQYPGRNDFHYFNESEMRKVPDSLRPHVMAANPWAGMLFSEDALCAIARRVQEADWHGGFCEMRVATVARSLGYQPIANPNPLAQRTLRAVTSFTLEQIDVQSVWHKVKTHDPLTLNAHEATPAPQCS